ncbi:hypothetical protein EDB89DRAFT_1913610, partial [Lactarius sanguifluus]
MPKVQSKGSKRSSAAAKKACAICMNHFRPQAFAAHTRKCEREKREEEELLEYKKEMIGKAQAQLAGASRPGMAIGTPPVHGAPELDTELDSDSDIADLYDYDIPEAVTTRQIRTEYHPNSRKPTKTRSVDNPPQPQMREDFVLSEILLESGLSNNLSEKLLELFRLCKTGKGEEQEFGVRCTLSPALGLGERLDTVVQLAKHFHWDAERIFWCTGDESVRVFNEPWSGDAFWDAQGYPVVARCANLPTTIRNGNGFGSGRVVRWLPIVKEDPMERKKPTFVNFKRTVWHKSFFVIIQSIVTHSKTGCWLECGDGVKRWLFPIVLILSADYEEQCVMSLIRGTKSKSPCPICLVKKDELADTKTWSLRTAAHAQELVQQARGHKRVKDREALLSAYGLRNAPFQQQWRLRLPPLGGFQSLIGRYSREEEAKVDA